MKMITVGVTGVIGSGKTTVCRLLGRLGARVVYADEIARERMVSEPELAAAIRAAFGEESYRPDGSLNREHLAREAFDRGRTEELNRLVHPAVGIHVEKLRREAERDGVKIFVKEAALLLAKGRPPGFDIIVLVSARPELSLGRAVERDGVSKEEVRRRMARQQSEEEMRRLADRVIENNGSVAELEEDVRRLYKELEELAG